MSQYTVPCAVYRGGTSRGLFFYKRDLPEDPDEQKRIFFAGIDAYNPSQVNGLGSGTSHTSKVVVISPPSVEGADVNYTFYQIGIGEEVADDKGTCGNLMAAVGAFAVDEGLVCVDPAADKGIISAFNTNIGKMLRISVPVIHGKARVKGDYRMPGLVTPGAKYTVDILDPGGGKTWRTLPLGASYTMDVGGREYFLSFVDVVNPFVYVSSEALGLLGTEPSSELASYSGLLEELDRIRCDAAVRSGMEKSVQDAKQAPAVPKVAIVSKPQDYVASTGKRIRAEEVDIVAKMLSMGRVHRTFAGSGLCNLAAAVLLPGTIPHRLAAKQETNGMQILRIGHPGGVAEVRVALTEDGRDVAFVGLERTARRIIKGDLYIPEKTIPHFKEE